MPCNPAIGGTGKGHLVRELDALGGEMGRAADRACIQYRLLNRGKGPAVRSLRAQADRRKYQEVMKHTLERQENLWVQAGGGGGHPDGRTGAVSGVVTHTGRGLPGQGGCGRPPAPIWRGRTIVGEVRARTPAPTAWHAAVAPDGVPDGGWACPSAASRPARRPGSTPAAWTFPKWSVQPGDEEPAALLLYHDRAPAGEPGGLLAHLHQRRTPTGIIRDNLDRSPLYSGTIEGVGPRYCPSIETKIVRFPDKARHQLFMEPMGLDTEELYIQGFSSSLPEEVQLEMLHTIPGLEQAEMTRCGLRHRIRLRGPHRSCSPPWRCKQVPGLYGAGQFNGSSGYEEAAVQGFVAGVNAALKLLGRSRP